MTRSSYLFLLWNFSSWNKFFLGFFWCLYYPGIFTICCNTGHTCMWLCISLRNRFAGYERKPCWNYISYLSIFAGITRRQSKEFLSILFCFNVTFLIAEWQTQEAESRFRQAKTSTNCLLHVPARLQEGNGGQGSRGKKNPRVGWGKVA